MIQDTRLLLRLRWQLGWNRFRNQKTFVQALSLLAIIPIAIVGLISSLAGLGLGALMGRFPEWNIEALMPGVLLTMLAVLFLFSSFGMALGALYLSSDLDLLMTAPVDRKAVFLSKILGSMGLNYMIGTVAALPALIAYGIGAGYGPVYYPLAVLAVLAVPLLPAGLGAITVMLVARVAPAKRVKEVLGLLGALFGIGCAVLGQTMRLWTSELEERSRAGEGILAALQSIASWPLPTLVGGRGLAAAGTGDMLTALAGLTGFYTSTFGLFALCVWYADTLHAAGWVRMQSSGSANRDKRRSAQAASKGGLLSRAPAWAAIMLKDWRIIPRDLRNFAQLMAPLIILPVIYLNILNDGGDEGEARGERNGPDFESLFSGQIDFTGVVIAGGILFAAVGVFNRIADTAISMEGKSWWLLKAAPLSPWELVRGKVFAAVIPFSILSLFLMLFALLWRSFDPFWFLYGMLGIQLLGVGILAFSVGVSIPWARLDWDDPNKMTNWRSSVVSFIGWIGIGGLGGGLLCLPLLAEAFNPLFVPLMAIVGFMLATLVTVGFTWAALRLGIARLGELGEA